MTNLETCQQEFREEAIKNYWLSQYEKVNDPLVARKVFQSAKLLRSNRQAHVFCQRAVQDLTEAIIPVNGKFSEETVDAVNFAINSGLSGQLKMTTAHYTANYLQLKVSPKKYGDYLKAIFD